MKNVELSPEYILKLTEEINSLLKEMNAFTDEILICSYDELEENIEKRDIRFEKMKEKFDTLKMLDDGSDADFHAIMTGNAVYDSLNDLYKKIYDGRAAISSAAAEIRSKDNLVFEKLAECRDVMLDNIKKLNSGNEANASKYYESSRAVSGQNIYFPKQGRKI